MKQLILLLVFMPLCTFCDEKDKAIKSADLLSENYDATIYLIRHAEKVRTDPNHEDPSLNIEGMMRAKRWAKYFEPIKIDEIYITKYMRTKQTISFIAQQKMISPHHYQPDAVFIESLLKNNNGKKILIVGHSNTIPKMVNDLIGEEKFKSMDDSDNATLFKVTIIGNEIKVETTSVE